MGTGAELYKIWVKLKELEADLANKEERISELESRLEAISPAPSHKRDIGDAEEEDLRYFASKDFGD